MPGTHRQTDRLPTAGGIAAAAMLVLVLSLLAFGASGADARAHVPKNFFGIDQQIPTTSADAKRMDKGGVEVLRVSIPWGVVQSGGKGEFDWSAIDNEIRAAADNGLKVLPFIYYTPDWVANNYRKLPIYNHRQIKAWKDFLKAAVGRYGPHGTFWTTKDGNDPPSAKKPIRNWQIWNEANFHYFAKPVSPKNYTKLLKFSRQALKSADSRSKIMLSGLYGSPKGSRKRALAANRFLGALYRKGAARYFDSVALHPYSPNTRQLKRLTRAFRKVMIKHGDRRTPMNITELGWGSDRATVFGKGSLRGQARQLKSGYSYLIHNRHHLKLRSVYWFSWKDMPRSVTTCNFCYRSGLFKAGAKFRAKPAWHAFKSFSR